MPYSLTITTISKSLIALLGCTAAASGFAAEAPYRIDNHLDLDEGFSIGLVHRTRFENLADNVQPGTSPNDQVLALRTIVNARYDTEKFSAQFEFADIRQELADEDSVLKNRTVNSRDILQATVGYRFGDRNNTWVRVGRFSEDWGSRRLVARNRYRNVINAWDGLVVHHRDTSGNEVRFMATEVVRRLPSDFQSMLDNEYENDESSSAQRFYGIHASLPDLLPGLVNTELYLYSLREKDTAELQTRNRRIDSFGFRIRSVQTPGSFDYEIETTVQLGKVRGSRSAADTTDLDHRAFFQYLSLGYTFDNAINLRLLGEFDYAGGDDDPFDQDSGRFDSLFGPTTFEFGVVSIYDPFNRSNLITPGLRLFADLTATVDFMASYRHFWLASDTDTWGRTGIRDTSGDSGSYLGQHLELRVRWNVLPGNLRVDTGAIYLDARNLSNKNSRFFYTGATFTF